MNFNDLCIIYAHSTADGRYSLSSHDIDFDDDIQGVNMVKEDCKSPANNDPLGINWTSEMVHYIMVLMSEQLHRGNKALKQLPREKFKIATKFGIQKLEFPHYN